MRKIQNSLKIPTKELLICSLFILFLALPSLSSAGWVKQTVDESTDNVGQYSSMAADSAGNLHISYYDFTNADLKYVSKVSGAWETPQTIDSGKFGVGSHSSLAVDSSNNVHISQFYDKPILPVDQSLRIISKVSGTWGTPQNIDNTASDVGQYSSIAVDILNNIHISYYDPSTAGGDLKFISKVSGIWGSSQYIDSTADNVGQYTSIATDSSRKVHISYYDVTNSSLKYATNASGSWVKSTIDNTADVGQYSSIAIDSSNKVHISYYDATSTSLKYATNASGSWLMITIDNSGTLGSYSSISADSSGKVHISYYNSGAGDLKYATNKNVTPGSGNCTSTNFYCETVDAPAASVGQYTSIEILSGVPHISYYDVTNGDLRYAYYTCTDNDGDGYGNPGHLLCTNGSAADCNDSNAAINPGATEICNNTNDDCDGSTDEGCDDDNDNYCDSAMTIVGTPGTCTAGGGDCNDTSGTVNPGAIEFMCDGFDQNCNGLADDDLNTDGDPVSYCYGDCNDNDNTIYPGSTEICDNKNNDCNSGTADGSGETWYGNPTSCGVGSCARTGQFTCTGGVKVNTCAPGTPVTEGPVGNATCNDLLDNDCDALTDGNDGGCFSPPQLTYEFDRMWPTLQQPWYFNGVSGVAIDSNSYVFVSDQLNNKMKMFTSNGQLVTQWGSYCELSSGSGCVDPDGVGPLEPGDGQFKDPWGVEVDNKGFVYVIDYYNSRIEKFTSDGQFVTKWGSYCNISTGSGCVDPDGGGLLQLGDGQFYYPTGVAVDVQGNVYIIEQGNNRIQKFTSDGQFVTKWGSYCQLSVGSGCIDPDGVGPLQLGDGQFWWPAKIEIDNSNFVYATDTYNYRVQKFTSDGQFVRKWGSYCELSSGSGCIDPDGGGPLALGDGQFDQIYAVTADDKGYIYISDNDSNRIQKFTSEGQFVTIWGGGSGLGDGQLEGTTDIAADRGFIYASSSLDRIQKFNDEGQFIDRWGSGNGDGEFVDPEGIALIESIDAVYVSELNGHRIQRFTLDGQFVTKWGSYCNISTGSGCVDPDGGGPLQSGDGQFSAPRGIAVYGSSNVFVIEYGNNRIQKFNENGTFISKWGSYCQMSNGNGCVDPDGGGPLQSGDGQFYTPMDTTVDGTRGYLYVADSGNNRIQKFDLNGNLISKWGSFGSNEGQFNFPSGVAVDDSGYVYVVDTLNHRVQRFTGNGVFLSEWGSQGGDEGEFDNPRGIAIDSNGYVYVTDRLNDRVQVFTADGVFITKFGETGSSPGQFSQSRRLKVSSTGKVYVSDSSRVQVFKILSFSSNNKAIIVAGGGPYAGNRLWEATQMNANFTYMTLNNKGFGKDKIYYLSSDIDLDLDNNGVLDDVDGDATIANLQDAIETWAADADNLFVYLVDHGGSGTFRMSETETLSATQLDSWLDTVQASISGNVTVIYDACESGSFLSALTPPPGKQRILVSSASSGQSSYFVNQGSVSFSNFFWTNVFNGSNVKDAFDSASLALTTAISNQTPMIDDNGNGVGNEAGDGTLASATYIGNGTVIYGNVPTIGSVASPQNINGTATATLTADNVTDSDGIARVWAVILPPNYASGASNNTVQGLPYIDLMPIPSTNSYTATFDQFNLEGTYQIAIYAKDRIGNTSMPSTTTVTVGSPLRRKAIIVSGGSQTDANWDGIRKGGQATYDTLKFQGYSDNDIYFTSPVTFTSGIDGTSTLSNLQYAVETWAADSTQDVILYMAGNGDSGTFNISSTETLSATDLDTWLDNLQNTIAGNVTVVYDASRSGSFIPLLTPPTSKKRIVLTSTDADNPAAFLSNGDVSFSRYFWGWVLNGVNVRDSYLYAKSAMSSYQTAQLDDNGDGTANETSDGPLAFNYAIGVGIRLAGNAPIVGSVIPDQILSGTTSLLLYAENVTTTGTLDRVWAIITPPDYYPAFADEVLPEVTLISVGSNRYEAAYNGFTQFGTYTVSIYAKDMDGNISTVKEITVQQQNAPDIYEDDNTYGQAKEVFLNHAEAQQHSFDIAGDSDWVMFYGQDGVIYEVQATNLESNSDVALELYDTNGTTQLWTYNGGGTGADEIKSWACTANGVYYIKVRHANSAIYGNNTGYDLDVIVPAMPTCSNGILSGKAKDASTLSVLSGVKVKPTDGNGIATASDTNGNYRTTRFVCGTVNVNIATDPYTGYNTYTGSGTFTADVTTTKNISMTSANSFPVANFTGSPTSGTAPLTVNFTNTSTGNDTPLSYAWDFDNNGTTDSTTLTPSAVYSAGTYTVKLTVTDSNGDANTLTNTSYISVCYSNANIVGSSNTYTSLQSAYNAAATGNTIQSRAVTLTENINFNRNITVTIQGGYNCDHSEVTGKTVITGAMTISNGTVTMENLQMQ